jgi:hypothetical protein
MSAISFDQTEPTLLRREDGGWLAVSPPNAPLHIGVAAWSADDARDRFVRAAKEWAHLLDGQSQDGEMALKPGLTLP